MATLKDIANLVGVNATTVSKALRGSSDIKRETAMQIQKVARELGYKRLHAADDAQSSVPRTIGIVCPEIYSSYYARIVHAVCDKAAEAGYDHSIVNTGFDQKSYVEAIERLARQARGMILLHLFDSNRTICDAMRRARALNGIPIVGITEQSCQIEDFDILSVDDKVGYRQAVASLTAAGHTRFAFIGDRYGEIRLNYINEVLAERGLALRAGDIAVSGDLRYYECGYALAGDLFKSADHPTALLAQYDDVAVGAMRRIREAGLRVPEDVAIVGYDNAHYCRFQSPPLASIDDNGAGLAAIASEILLKKIRVPGYSVVQSVGVKSTFVARESSGASPRSLG